jgi:hypothetical protein
MTSLTTLSFQLRLGALCVMLGSSGCETPAAKSPAPNLSPADHPACQRLHELINANESRVVVELPAVALLLSRSFPSEAVRNCSDELVRWVRPTLQARPLELVPSLEARVAALGALNTRAWNESAFQILIELMGLEATQVLVHFEQRSIVPGPGSRKIPLMLTASISLETLQGWTADALVRAHLGRQVDSAYADLLVRHFTKVAEPSPEVQRDAATTLLWPELVRAFEVAPKDPRWSGVPAYWRERLQALTQPGSTSPQ